MPGMNRTAGAPVEGLEAIRQSIADILSTRVGSRVGRREYGSLLPDLVDHPRTPANVLRLYAATALAISRWEGRLRLARVSLAAGPTPGASLLVLDATRTDTAPANARTRLTLPL